MSDPVTNVDLEDVLSSIRRLVADRDPAPARPAPAEPERFLLTPALRVAGEDPAPGPRAANDSAPLLLAAIAGDGAPPPPADLSDEAAGVVARLAARIEAAVTVQDSDFEPDGSEEVPVMDWSTPAPEDAPVFRSRQPHPLRVLTPAPEEPVFQHRAWDPAPADDDDDEDEAARTGGPADLAEDLARSSRDLLEDDLDPEISALFGQETLIDEEMLRNLVVEIVRQELQGTLGERITRNVRKLVRREIYRVLASQELE